MWERRRGENFVPQEKEKNTEELHVAAEDGPRDGEGGLCEEEYVVVHDVHVSVPVLFLECF